MGRFSKAEARHRGWRFVHDKPEQVEDLGDGVTRTIPRSIRAEKDLSPGLVNEEAETEGLLLERINAWESAQNTPLEGSPEPVLESPEGDQEINRGVLGAEKFQRGYEDEDTVSDGREDDAAWGQDTEPETPEK